MKYGLLSALLLCCGCEAQDTDRMARLGKLGLEKIQTLAGTKAKLITSLTAPSTDEPLDARVSARLQWEKSLADAQITVGIKDGKVELKGKVSDEGRRRRAVELAESTVGAGQVVDLLEVPEEEEQ